MESYLISMGLTIVLNLLKNEKHRAKYKKALLKVCEAIVRAFPEEAKNVRQEAKNVQP